MGNATANEPVRDVAAPDPRHADKKSEPGNATEQFRLPTVQSDAVSNRTGYQVPALDIGEQLVGSTARHHAMPVANLDPGGRSASVHVMIAGAGFSVAAPALRTLRSIYGGAVAQGEVVAPIEFDFAPTRPGPVEASLTITTRWSDGAFQEQKVGITGRARKLDAVPRSEPAATVCELQGNPVPFQLKSSLEFAGVVGHATPQKTLEILNKELHQNHASLKIVGSDAASFAVDSPDSVLVPGKTGGTMPLVDVHFVPNRPGSLDAVLLVNHEFGQQSVRLLGTAMQGDGQATARDGTLPGISPLPELDRSQPKALADHLREAGRHVAEIGERFQAVQPRPRTALRALNANATTAATSLHGRITRWLTDEGIADARAVDGPDMVASGATVATAALKVVLSRVKLAAPEAALPITVAQFVIKRAIGFALSERAEGRADEKRQDAVAHEELAGAKASAADPMLGGIVQQLGSLGQELAKHMGTLDGIIKGTPQFLASLPAAVAAAERGDNVGASEYARAEQMLNSYVEDEGLMWQALANVELFAQSIVSRTDAAFDDLLSEFATERHTQASASGRDDRKFRLQITGTFDLDQEPPVQLQQMAIEGIGNVSSTMKQHIANKRLAELPEGCGARIELTAMPYGTIVYEWDFSSKELYHYSTPYDPAWREFGRLNGNERIKSALLDLKVGDGVSQ